MITSVIIAIMATCASFYFSAQQQTANAEAAINHLQQLLITAQLQAIKDNIPVTVCALNTADDCSGDWNSPITAFTEHQKIQQVSLLKDNNAELSFSGFPTSRYLTVTPLGLAGQQNGTFVYCRRYGSELILRGLSISRTGRMRVLKQNDPYFKDTHIC